MSRGERMVVTCPANKAYGSRGAGGVIPPNSDLDFDIEMIDFSGKGDL
jgi:FKBP-type peptidyl-prolyl cis-trans isomerase